MERLNTQKKVCSKCKQVKIITEFSKDKRSKDGLYGICKTCNKEYYKNNIEKIKEFYKKPCNKEYQREYQKEYRKNNVEKLKQYYYNRDTEKEKQYYKDNIINTRNNFLKHKFGIDIKQYHQMYKDQDGNCLICGKPQSELKGKLCVDHDHITGKIRGLVCADCNHGLGNFKDTPRILQKAIDYLNKHK